MDFSHEKDGLNMQRSWLHTVWIRGIRSERFRFDQHFCENLAFPEAGRWKINVHWMENNYVDE